MNQFVYTISIILSFTCVYSCTAEHPAIVTPLTDCQKDLTKMSGNEDWNFVNKLGDTLNLKGQGILISSENDNLPANETVYMVEKWSYTYSNDTFALIFDLITKPENYGSRLHFTFNAKSYTGYSQHDIQNCDDLLGNGFTREDSISIQGKEYYNVQVNYNRQFIYSETEGLIRFMAKWPSHDGVAFERINN